MAIKEFKVKTKREKFLVDLLWKTLDQLEESDRQYVPIATARSDSANHHMAKILLKIPLLRKRMIKKRLKIMKGIDNGKEKT